MIAKGPNERGSPPPAGAGLKIYSGTKFFWKAKTSLEFTVLQYAYLGVIEVVSWSVEDYVELQRVYLNAKLLADRVDKDDLDRAMEAKKEKNARDKVSMASAALRDEVWKELLCNMIIGRASVTIVDKDKKVFTVPPDLNDAVLSEVPEIAEPFVLKKAQRVTIEDFNAAVTTLQKESVNLRLANNLASNVAGLQALAVGAFQTTMKKKQMASENLSAPKKKWRSVVNRVVVLNYINGVRKVLGEKYPQWGFFPIDQEVDSSCANNTGASDGEGIIESVETVLDETRNSKTENLPSLSKKGSPVEKVPILGTKPGGGTAKTGGVQQRGNTQGSKDKVGGARNNDKGATPGKSPMPLFRSASTVTASATDAAANIEPNTTSAPSPTSEFEETDATAAGGGGGMDEDASELDAFPVASGSFIAHMPKLTRQASKGSIAQSGGGGGKKQRRSSAFVSNTGKISTELSAAVANASAVVTAQELIAVKTEKEEEKMNASKKEIENLQELERLNEKVTLLQNDVDKLKIYRKALFHRSVEVHSFLESKVRQLKNIEEELRRELRLSDSKIKVTEVMVAEKTKSQMQKIFDQRESEIEEAHKKALEAANATISEQKDEIAKLHRTIEWMKEDKKESDERWKAKLDNLEALRFKDMAAAVAQEVTKNFQETNQKAHAALLQEIKDNIVPIASGITSPVHNPQQSNAMKDDAIGDNKTPSKDTVHENIANSKQDTLVPAADIEALASIKEQLAAVVESNQTTAKRFVDAAQEMAAVVKLHSQLKSKYHRTNRNIQSASLDATGAFKSMVESTSHDAKRPFTALPLSRLLSNESLDDRLSGGVSTPPVGSARSARRNSLELRASSKKSFELRESLPLMPDGTPCGESNEQKQFRAAIAAADLAVSSHSSSTDVSSSSSPTFPSQVSGVTHALNGGILESKGEVAVSDSKAQDIASSQQAGSSLYNQQINCGGVEVQLPIATSPHHQGPIRELQKQYPDNFLDGWGDDDDEVSLY